MNCSSLRGGQSRGGAARETGGELPPLPSHTAPLQPHGLYNSWNFPGENTGEGSLSLSPADLPNPGIEQGSPALQADSLPTELSGKPLCGLRNPRKSSLGSPSIREGGASPGHPEGPAVPSVLRQDRTQTCRECGLAQGTDPGPLLTWDPLPSNSIQTSPFPTAGFEYHPLQEAFPLAALPHSQWDRSNAQ